MYISVNLDLDNQKQISNYVKEHLPETITNEIFKDENKLKSIIKQCVQNQIKGAINEILQGKDYKEFLREKIMIEMGIKNDPLNDSYFEGLTREDIAHLAKKSIRLTTENSELTHKLEELSSKVDDCLGIDCAWCMNVNCPKEKKGNANE